MADRSRPAPSAAVMRWHIDPALNEAGTVICQAIAAHIKSAMDRGDTNAVSVTQLTRVAVAALGNAPLTITKKAPERKHRGH